MISGLGFYPQIEWYTGVVEETTDVNTVICVCIELPSMDFGFFDNAFDAAIIAAQSTCLSSKFLAIVSFACFISNRSC